MSKMDFHFGEKEEKLRLEIREFVKENLPPEHIPALLEDEHSDEAWEFSMSISKKLGEKGWLTISWPKKYGGMEGSLWEQLVLAEEIGYWGIPGHWMGAGGTGWVGPSLIMFGSEEQKEKYLPPIAAGEPDGIWCTGYSEPDAGSDFANIQIQAVRKGDEYIINGQKVWTSYAHRARWCWLAARTDPNPRKKHHGISLIIVDMKSEGISVRPIPNYVGLHSLNEVFFTDVRVPVTNLVGIENNGWNQIISALAFERSAVAGFFGTTKRVFDELVHYANDTGLIKRPEIRQKLAEMIVEVESLRLLVYETAWKTSKGINVIYEPSRDKAFIDVVAERLTCAGMEILGDFSQVDLMHKDSKWTKTKGAVSHLYWNVPGLAISAGTTHTQKNIDGQFGLGLPRSY
jgi:alkylation response protein AidB-like acyl-CoA dehydrogenase